MPASTRATSRKSRAVFDAYLADLEAGRAGRPRGCWPSIRRIAEQLRACLRRSCSLADQMANGSSIRRRGSCAAHGIRPHPAHAARIQPAVDPGISATDRPRRIHLQRSDGRVRADDPAAIARDAGTFMEARPGPARLQLGEIARGGMGVILKGRDVDLGRDLAIKVLLESHKGDTDVVRRFVEEAQIGGQLQHPGIVPVYELGTFPEPDRRPYFAMKLVKGRTLASLLHERVGRGPPDPVLARRTMLGADLRPRPPERTGVSAGSS